VEAIGRVSMRSTIEKRDYTISLDMLSDNGFVNLKVAGWYINFSGKKHLHMISLWVIEETISNMLLSIILKWS
jgi:hypothetical protein